MLHFIFSFDTVHAFIEMVKFFVTILDVKVISSNRFSQDPLENIFSQQHRGRVNENPNSHDFINNTQALRVINNVCSNVKENCRGSEENSPFHRAPLPKRPRNH